MKYLQTTMAAAVLAALVGCGQQDSAEAPSPAKTDDGVELSSHQQKLSYLAALDFVNKYHAQGIPLDANAVAAAVRDVMSGTEIRLSEDEVAATVARFQEEQLERQQQLAKLHEEAEAQAEAEFEKQAAANTEAGQKFFADNGQQAGVVTTASGLQYKIISAGSGAVPAASDRVEVHYRGTLLDGTEFDSSHKRGAPAKFGVGEVIPGWTEVLQLMPEGSKWEVYIPGELAYGPGGTGNIGPNATLVFEIELLSIDTPEPQ